MPTTPAGARNEAVAPLRSLFISDLHLGARACQPTNILRFLRPIHAETIYLVGDIFDLWHGGRIHWTDAHDAVVADLSERVRSGVRVVYLPGNHDAALRAPGSAVANWELREAVMHEAGDGRRYLVLHGDQCDRRIMRWHGMTRLGSRMDAGLRQVEDWMSARRRAPLDEKRSLVQRAIHTANDLMVMGDWFETRLCALASAAGAQGVICGHSHKPALRAHGGLTYANCGDWVDSLTALAEDASGALRLMEWKPAALSAPQNRPCAVAEPQPGAFAGDAA